MTNPITKKYIVLSMWLSIAISILVHFSSLFDEFVSHIFTSQMAFRFAGNALSEISITFIIGFILFWINFYILKPLQTSKKINWINYTSAFAVSFVVVIFSSHYLFAIKRSV